MMRPRDQQSGLIQRCHADCPVESTTTKGASEEEDDPEDLTTMPEALAEDIEEIMHLWIRGQQWRLRRCDDKTEKLSTTTEASADEDDPKDSTTMTEASAEEAEETTRMSERL